MACLGASYGRNNHQNKYVQYLMYARITLYGVAFQIIIAGEMEAEDTKSLLRVVHSFYIPNRVLIVHSPNSSTSFLSHHIPSLEKMVSENGCATAYVCENFTCLSPTCDPEKLKGLIDPTKHLKV